MLIEIFLFRQPIISHRWKTHRFWHRQFTLQFVYKYRRLKFKKKKNKSDNKLLILIRQAKRLICNDMVIIFAPQVCKSSFFILGPFQMILASNGILCLHLTKNWIGNKHKFVDEHFCHLVKCFSARTVERVSWARHTCILSCFIRKETIKTHHIESIHLKRWYSQIFIFWSACMWAHG